MNVRLLVDGIVRQTTVLVARIATTAGVRALALLLETLAEQITIGVDRHEPRNEPARPVEAVFRRKGRATCKPTPILRSHAASKAKSRRIVEFLTVVLEAGASCGSGRERHGTFEACRIESEVEKAARRAEKARVSDTESAEVESRGSRIAVTRGPESSKELTGRALRTRRALLRGRRASWRGWRADHTSRADGA